MRHLGQTGHRLISRVSPPCGYSCDDGRSCKSLGSGSGRCAERSLSRMRSFDPRRQTNEVKGQNMAKKGNSGAGSGPSRAPARVDITQPPKGLLALLAQVALREAGAGSHRTSSPGLRSSGIGEHSQGQRGRCEQHWPIRWQPRQRRRGQDTATAQRPVVSRSEGPCAYGQRGRQECWPWGTRCRHGAANPGGPPLTPTPGGAPGRERSDFVLWPECEVRRVSEKVGL